MEGAVAIAAREGLTSTLSQIFMFLTDSRMITAYPLVKALASAIGDVVKDTRGMKDIKELGKSMVQIAKATDPLREHSF